MFRGNQQETAHNHFRYFATTLFGKVIDRGMDTRVLFGRNWHCNIYTTAPLPCPSTSFSVDLLYLLHLISPPVPPVVPYPATSFEVLALDYFFAVLKALIPLERQNYCFPCILCRLSPRFLTSIPLPFTTPYSPPLS